MDKDANIRGLGDVGNFLRKFLAKENTGYEALEEEFQDLLLKAEVENPWFTQENIRYALRSFGEVLQEDEIRHWVGKYPFASSQKKVGVILAGNIPLVGFHDLICVILSGHMPLIKLSSKDRLIIPFLMKLWSRFTPGEIVYHIVEKLQNHDAVIATGSNNTARYLEFYFKDCLSLIRKNRTSIAVLTGDEDDKQLQLLGRDIFQYFGLGCRNVNRLFIPHNFQLERLFKNFMHFKDVIHHHKYANNYDYHRAVYLLNQEPFWDNDFMILRENEELFSPLSVINFSRYSHLTEVEVFVNKHQQAIQCVVGGGDLGPLSCILFGEAQSPALDVYADNVDTMEFLSVV